MFAHSPIFLLTPPRVVPENSGLDPRGRPQPGNPCPWLPLIPLRDIQCRRELPHPDDDDLFVATKLDMYTPAHFEEAGESVMHSLIRSYPLATLITQAPAGINADHLPLLLVRTNDASVLQGHVAHANPLWAQVAAGAPVLAIFQGPSSYISPNWYPSKRRHGKVVPTWNYLVVHARGTIQWYHDARWLREHLEALTEANERSDRPWHVSDAPTDFIDRMLSRIVGFEVRIAKLSGKWKLSQNRDEIDRRGVKDGLKAQADTGASEMLHWMERNDQKT